ncbi:hypothetical protein [Clostridium sp. BL-8]|nr:hypothetical protein [Clostridium sp. BL-8]
MIIEVNLNIEVIKGLMEFISYVYFSARFIKILIKHDEKKKVSRK